MIKKIILLSVSACVLLLLVSCNALWSIKTGTDISFKINLTEYFSSNDMHSRASDNFSLNRNISLDDFSEKNIQVSLYNVNTGYVIDRKTLYVNELDSLNIEVLFSNIGINQAVYAELESKDNNTIYFRSRSPNLLLKEGVNYLAARPNAVFYRNGDKEESGNGLTLDNPLASSNIEDAIAIFGNVILPESTIYILGEYENIDDIAEKNPNIQFILLDGDDEDKEPASKYSITYYVDNVEFTDSALPSEYTQGVGVNAVKPTHDPASIFYTDWYDNENLFGDPVANIGSDESGNKTLYAKKYEAPFAVLDYTLSNGEYEVEGVTTSAATVVIPDVHPDDGLPITSIDYDAFNNDRDITKVYIGNNVEIINYRAFQTAMELEDVHIGNSVTTINGNVFENTRLSHISIPASVTTIGSEVFSGCWNLSNIIIEDTNDSFAFDGRALYDKNKTTLLFYLETLTSATFDMPDTVETILAGAFKENETIETVNLSSSLKVIEEDAFLRCSNLIVISLPNGLTSIGWDAFSSTGLTSIWIPITVKSMGSTVFSHCYSLPNIRVEAASDAGWDEDWDVMESIDFREFYTVYYNQPS